MLIESWLVSIDFFVEILLAMYFMFSEGARVLVLLKICSFMLVLKAIRLIWRSRTVRYDNIIY